jgi:hypothetical protein
MQYNLINVSTQFTSCISLLYCLCEYDGRSPSAVNDPAWRMEVAKRVAQCTDLLEAFSRALPETAKYREIFTKLSDLLLARHGPLPAERDSTGAYLVSAFDTPNPVPSTSVLPPSVVPAPNPTQKDEDGSAWTAMTQLWHNAGDFSFDEAALRNPLGVLGIDQMGMREGEDARLTGLFSQGEGSNSMMNGLGVNVGIDSGLWNQLG